MLQRQEHTMLLLPELSRNEFVAWHRALSLHLRGQLQACESTSWYTAVAQLDLDSQRAVTVSFQR